MQRLCPRKLEKLDIERLWTQKSFFFVFLFVYFYWLGGSNNLKAATTFRRVSWVVVMTYCVISHLASVYIEKTIFALRNEVFKNWNARQMHLKRLLDRSLWTIRWIWGLKMIRGSRDADYNAFERKAMRLWYRSRKLSNSFSDMPAYY